jgi:hypothetical protein
MAPFSVDDRAEKGGGLIRALGRSPRAGLQNVFILLERNWDWGSVAVSIVLTLLLLYACSGP